MAQPNWQCRLPPAPCYKGMDLQHWVALGTRPLLSNNQTISILFHYQCCVDWNQGMGRAVLHSADSSNGKYCMHFDTLARHSALSSEEYTAMLSRLIKKFENRFQDYKKNQFTFPTLFAFDINTWPENFEIDCIEFQSDVQLSNLIMSLYQTFKIPILPEKKTLHFTVKPYSCHHFLAVCIFENSCQGGSTGRVKLNQKSLMHTLRTH